MSNNSNKLCVDLCSGLGGFSQAFVDARWEVIRIDNNPKFAEVPFTTVADVCDVDSIVEMILKKGKPRVILASPPCNIFSVAGMAWGFPRVGVKKALEVVGACLEIIARLEPGEWALENPRGMLRRIIGKPATTVRYSDWNPKQPTQKPTDLWGNVRLPIAPMHRRPYSGRGQDAEWRRKWGNDPAKAAKVPLELSQAILTAVEGAPA
ncbi:MAG: DNA cytosine methyltransferase [Thaumarchaeota archaeon]|nr:DNA cytosine methyltransferase [Nitrososphaerota archaeon]